MQLTTKKAILEAVKFVLARTADEKERGLANLVARSTKQYGDVRQTTGLPEFLDFSSLHHRLFTAQYR